MEIALVLASMTLINFSGFLPTAGFHFLGYRSHYSAHRKVLYSSLGEVQALADSAISDSDNSYQLKEEQFVKWMTSDSLEEIQYPGVKIEIIGNFPSYVRGSYIKNGPSAFSTADKTRRFTHFFDGLAKLIKFDIRSGDDGNAEVTFVARFVDSYWKRCMLDRNFMPPTVSLGPVIPPFNFAERLWASVTSLIMFDNTSVNIDQISSTDTFVATTDVAVSTKFDPKTLETIGKISSNEAIGGCRGITFLSTAHPKTGMDGLSYNYFLEFSLDGIFAHIVRTNSDLSRTSIGKVSTDGKIVYIHDLSITDNFAILCVYPLHLRLTGFISKSLFASMHFDPTRSTKIHVFTLNNEGKLDEKVPLPPVATFETQAFWAYHHLNAYEEYSTNMIVLDVLAYENATMVNGPHGYLYMDNMKTKEGRMKENREAALWRFRLDMSAGTPQTVVPIKSKVFDSETKLEYTMELATVSPKVHRKKHRYVYCFTGFHRGELGYMDWALFKRDVEKGEMESIWYEEFSYPGEPVFIPNPESEEEDGGVVLSIVFNSKREESFLLLLDASNMKEIARAYTGIGMHSGFHGKFFPLKSS